MGKRTKWRMKREGTLKLSWDNKDRESILPLIILCRNDKLARCLRSAKEIRFKRRRVILRGGQSMFCKLLTYLKNFRWTLSSWREAVTVLGSQRAKPYSRIGLTNAYYAYIETEVQEFLRVIENTTYRHSSYRGSTVFDNIFKNIWIIDYNWNYLFFESFYW